MKKKRKKRINLKKFLSRILLLVLIIIAIVLLIKAIFKPKNNEEVNKLIVDKVDITENLNSEIYIDPNGTLYMSIEDIKNIFDTDLYYEESSGKIITTSETKVGAIDVKNNLLELNSATISIASRIIDYGTTYYIPISEIADIYNIEVTVKGKTAIILYLYKSLSTMNTIKKVSIKEKPSAFSSTIEKLIKDERVIFLENSEKSGWVKVLTYNGNIGYAKKEKFSDIQVERTAMQDFTNGTKDTENSLEINSKKIKDENLIDFTARKKVVEDIVKDAIDKEKYTININLKDITVNKENLERFIIELIPRLNSIGGSIIITNNNILDNEFLNKYDLNM